MSDLVKIIVSPAIAETDLTDLLADWLNLDVANGDACADTLNTYQSQIQTWLTWCRENSVYPGQATTEDVKNWRKDLIDTGAKPSTISLKRGLKPNGTKTHAKHSRASQPADSVV